MRKLSMDRTATTTTTAKGKEKKKKVTEVGKVTGSKMACTYCSESPATTSCSKCQVVCYCSEECRKLHWMKVHHKDCAAMAKNLPAQIAAKQAECYSRMPLFSKILVVLSRHLSSLTSMVTSSPLQLLVLPRCAFPLFVPAQAYSQFSVAFFCSSRKFVHAPGEPKHGDECECKKVPVLKEGDKSHPYINVVSNRDPKNPTGKIWHSYISVIAPEQLPQAFLSTLKYIQKTKALHLDLFEQSQGVYVLDVKHGDDKHTTRTNLQNCLTYEKWVPEFE